MTSKHKRRTPLIRRLTSIVAVFAIFIMSIPMASAANATGSSAIKVKYANSASGTMNMSVHGAEDASYSYSSTTKQETWHTTAIKGSYWGITEIPIGMSNVESAVGVYISWFFASSSSVCQSTGVMQSFTGQYNNHEGNTGTLPSVDVDDFTPSGYSNYSIGHSVKAQFEGTPDLPISNIILKGSTSASSASWKNTAGGSSYSQYLVVPSFRVVTTEYSAELDAMEEMADAIAQQNEMMQAMYGEIIALCNAIYTKCGDLETAINTTNSYCSAMLEALGDIATTTNNIYTLLGTQFALLISTIQTESSNIQDTIMEAEAKLEAYLDSAVNNSGIADSGTASEDASTAIGDLNSGSEGYESNASASFENISASFTGFSGGTLGGVALATDLFSQVFNALGEYKVVYTFPLLLGVCLVLIGRISRHSGGASSRKEDKEE